MYKVIDNVLYKSTEEVNVAELRQKLNAVATDIAEYEKGIATCEEQIKQYERQIENYKQAIRSAAGNITVSQEIAEAVSPDVAPRLFRYSF